MRYIYVLVALSILFVLTSCKNDFDNKKIHSLTNNVEVATGSVYTTKKEFGEWAPDDLREKHKSILNRDNQISEVINFVGDSDEITLKHKYDDQKLITIQLYNREGDEIRRRQVFNHSNEGYSYKEVDKDGKVMRIGNLKFQNGKSLIYNDISYQHGVKSITKFDLNDNNEQANYIFFSESLKDSVFTEGSFEKLDSMQIEEEKFRREFEYVHYDEFGNWLTRLIYIDDDVNPSWIENRELEYWE